METSLRNGQATLASKASARELVEHLIRRRRSAAPGDLQAILPSHKIIDWDEFLQIVSQERVGGLIYLETRGEGWLPENIQAALYNQYLATAQYALIYQRELEDILRLFSEEEINVLILKGAALVNTVFENPALRPMEDIDLLVKKEDAARAISKLKEVGYAAEKVERRVGAELQEGNELRLTKAHLYPVSVEIHWSLFDSPYYQQNLPMDWFWESAERIDIGGIPARSLGVEAQIIYLCAHLVLHHGGKGLLWLNDIAELVHQRSAEIHWDGLISHASECCLVLPLKQVFLEIGSDWLSNLPVDLRMRIESLEVSDAERKVFEALHSTNRSVGQRFIDDLGHFSSWRQRFLFMYNNLFPSKEYMKARYQVKHGFLLPITYLYRWYLGLTSLFGKKE